MIYPYNKYLYKGMIKLYNNLPIRDRLPLMLRELYEKYAYKNYRMNKFENYDVYRENKSFLKNDEMITFTNPDGKLMALKPDVTMAIAKNSTDTDGILKLYYNENVYRLQPGNNEYSEINQMGLEFIGGEDYYSQAEVTLLALRSLELIDKNYRLNIAHMGYLNSILDFVCSENSARNECLELIKQKNQHGIEEFAQKNKLNERKTQALKRIVLLSGDLDKVLPKLEGSSYTNEMASAVRELRELNDSLKDFGTENIKLDFSVIDDPDYYNGIVFQGFVPLTPRAVLTGGRYDNLMRRFGKQRNAIGFAVYLGELDRALHTFDEYDTDLLLIYGDASAKQVLSAIEQLKSDYAGIRAEKEMPDSIRAKKIIYIDDTKKVNR